MFVLSSISVIVQVAYFKRTKKRIFLMAPLHHHFQEKGAKREYDASKGIFEEEEDETCMSGIPSRPYCKGRNYDPNRYNTEE